MSLLDVVKDVCSDPQRAEKLLTELGENFLQSGSRYSLEDFSAQLSVHLRRSPDADLAVTNFRRYADATLSKSFFFNDLLAYPVWFDLLMTICGSSQYFSDILVRDPELFRWLTATDALDSFQSEEVYAREIQHVHEAFEKPERKLNALRRLYRREMLRIGSRDLLGNADLRATTASLSTLADTIVEAIVSVAVEQIRARALPPNDCGFSIIGLGKLGGNELNYSSDIDILFLYEKEGEFIDAAGKALTFHEYFNKLAEKIVQNLSGPSSEGHLYRVDTRLRPESGAGPLARSLQSYLQYYESRGELWERQMLIKARVIAGEKTLGMKFIQELRPFVYPRTLFDHPAQAIARIKARIELAVQGEENIKLQAGGIRDIEFIVQTLQLINGGRNPAIQCASTLESIELLESNSLLTSAEATSLKNAYFFFRAVEHRLQFFLNTQTHEFPGEAQERGRLAKRMGLADGAVLQASRLEHARNVRRIFNTVLAVEPTPVLTGIEAVLDEAATEETIATFLSSHGIRDVRQGIRSLRYLVTGSALSNSREIGTRARDAFRRVAGEIFASIAKSNVPDLTLQNIATIASGFSFRDQAYKQLAEESYRNIIISIAATSPRLSRQLAGQPLILERLPDEIDSPVISLSGESMHAQKLREELIAGVRFVLGEYPFEELTERLTHIADQILTEVLMNASREYKFQQPPFAVYALGKYGTAEITFDADLDVLFVSEDVEGKEQERTERVANEIFRIMSEFSVHGRLYEVDARLRPEGKNAPLVVGESSLGSYYESRASLWERQSMTRIRLCCGNAEVGNRVQKRIAEWVYTTPLPEGWVDEIVAMRKKTETRSRMNTSHYYDVKLGPGGMVDIEFLSQMIQMKFGNNDLHLRGLQTVQVINAAPAKVLTLKEREDLTKAYALYRRCETGMRLVLEDQGSVLPTAEKLELLAQAWFGIGSERLEEDIRESMSHVRDIFVSSVEQL